MLVAAGIAITLAGVGQLDRVLRRVEHANPELLALAAALETLSFAGYIGLTRIVFRPGAPRISWSESVQITLAGVVATRLVAAGGIGGIALTVWALRAAGLDTRTAARRLAAFLVVLYAVFFAALGVVGAGLATGAFAGGAPRVLALAGAAVTGVVFCLALAAVRAPHDLEQRARRAAEGAGPTARLASRLATTPAFAREAVGLALRIVRTRPSASAAAIAWWAFDIAVLWAAFKMFGSPPAIGVLVLCYFLGQLAQGIPVPVGIGPVEGGMIAFFAASGVPVDLAVVSVITYRAISAWLPAAPGLWGYVSLRRTVATWRADERAGGGVIRPAPLAIDGARQG